MVIGEADGMSERRSPDVLRDEKRRQERMERMGFLVVRWDDRDIRRGPAEVIARLRSPIDPVVGTEGVGTDAFGSADPGAGVGGHNPCAPVLVALPVWSCAVVVRRPPTSRSFASIRGHFDAVHRRRQARGW